MAAITTKHSFISRVKVLGLLFATNNKPFRGFWEASINYKKCSSNYENSICWLCRKFKGPRKAVRTGREGVNYVCVHALPGVICGPGSLFYDFSSIHKTRRAITETCIYNQSYAGTTVSSDGPDLGERTPRTA